MSETITGAKDATGAIGPGRLVLVVGPIGWAALIFGTPLWLLGTGLIVGSSPRVRQRSVAAATV